MIRIFVILSIILLAIPVNAELLEWPVKENPFQRKDNVSHPISYAIKQLNARVLGFHEVTDQPIPGNHEYGVKLHKGTKSTMRISKLCDNQCFRSHFLLPILSPVSMP